MDMKDAVVVPVCLCRCRFSGVTIESLRGSRGCLLRAPSEWKIREKMMHAVGRRRGEKENEQRSDA
jgi:hypothetical protein